MSKSLGNVVDPSGLIDGLFACKPDPLRYFLLRTGKLNSDSPFSSDGLKSCYNSELVGNLGNLISRVFKRYLLEEMGTLSVVDRTEDGDLNEKISWLEVRSDEAYDQFQFGVVADLSMDVLSSANRYISKIEPWKFTDPLDHEHVASQIAHLIRKVTCNLSPIIPESAEAVDLVFRGKKALPLKGGLFPRLVQ